jgi:uncharacterized protein DUF4340
VELEEETRMRSGRSLLVLVVAFAGLVAYLYFVDAKKPVTEEGTEKRDKVFTVESDKIQELRVTSSSGETSTLKKNKDGWQLLEPVATKIDESEVSGITSNLASAEVQNVVDESPSNLQPYGLDKPRFQIAFKTAGDKDYRRLLVGSKTPTGGDLYAQRAGEKKVFLIPSYLESSLDRKPFDLRDKKILAFDREKVDRLEIAHDDVKLELVKSGQDWRLTAPVQAPADFSAVETIVTRLQSAQMKSIASDPAGDLKQYGLDKPAATATIGLGSSRATLAFGKAAESGDVYARDVTRQAVVTVGNDLLTDIKKNAADLRRKDIFEFRAFNAKRVEITRGAQAAVFEKVKGSGKDATEKWRRVSPSAGDIDQAKFETFLSNLSGLRAQSFADAKTPTGLDSPVAVVKVRFDETNKQEEVRFGRVGSDVYAGRSGEPGAARVETKAFDEALKSLDDVK